MKKIYYSFFICLCVCCLASPFETKAQQSKQEIKDHFRNGYAPGAVHFGYLVDACYNYTISEGLIYDPANNTLKAEVPVRLLEQHLADTARVLRSEQAENRNSLAELKNKLSDDVNRLDGRINGTLESLKDTAFNIRSDYQDKLGLLESSLKDDNNVLRNALQNLDTSLNLKIDNGDNNLQALLNNARDILIRKIDSLANVHNVDRKKHEDRMSLIENNHSVLNDTVVKMKTKLDTLNYTEENFTQTLRFKLDNIEDGATRSDNNFTDKQRTKLDGIEENANNYQLPLGTHNKLGGIQLSQDFVLYNGRAYNALDASKIDREYATDTITKNWTPEMKNGDEWTRIRYKIENGQVDAQGNKLYDYGEWNQAYKFIYDDLETSYYEFNATDSANVILGIHEKDKKFNGEDNTLLGHNAGYTLYKGGQRNVLIGKSAGRASENVSDNVFIGNSTGESIGDPSKIAEITGEFSGERNVAAGSKAMQGRNATGKSIAIGYSAMELGEQNSSIAIGYKAAAENSGNNNILIGYEAGLSTPGSKSNNNIAIGYRVGYKNTYTKRNVFIGDSAAFANESGEKNIFIGHGAGKSNTGNRNVIIGNNVDVAGNNRLAIGNNGTVLITGDFVSGEVSIGKLTSNELLVQESKSDSYSVGNKKVIDNAARFVGEGGVNTTSRIISNYTNTKYNSDMAISAPNGSVSGKYLRAAEGVLIGASDVIEKSGTFVGKGGVNTAGSITTGASVNATSTEIKESLKVAGYDIVKTSAGTTVERYALKTHKHNLSELGTDATHRFVTDAEKTNWNNKVDKIPGKGLSSNDYTDTEKSKLAEIEKHPATHSADMITTNTNKQFVSQAEKDNWNAGQIPIGGIIMWNGTTVPDGWALCNGQTINGKVTPDLRGRFIVGSYPGKSDFNVGKSGGSVGNSPQNIPTSTNGNHTHSGNTGTYKLTKADIPWHKHEFKNYYFIESSDVPDDRAGSSYGSEYISNGVGTGKWDTNNSRVFYKKMNTEAYGTQTYSQSAHKHSISEDGNHNHTVTVPYYVLAFIMRVK